MLLLNYLSVQSHLIIKLLFTTLNLRKLLEQVKNDFINSIKMICKKLTYQMILFLVSNKLLKTPVIVPKVMAHL